MFVFVLYLQPPLGSSYVHVRARPLCTCVLHMMHARLDRLLPTHSRTRKIPHGPRSGMCAWAGKMEKKYVVVRGENGRRGDGGAGTVPRYIGLRTDTGRSAVGAWFSSPTEILLSIADF